MTYGDYLDGKPTVITAALTGGVHGKEAHPDLPETPEEVASAAAACEDAGASVLHLHARRENGERAFSAERFQELADAVREATDDAVLQHSTGGTAAPDALRHEPLRTDPAPEMASLDMGPLNRYDRLTSENTRELVASLQAEMRERGIKPELEVFNDGQLNESLSILDELGDPPYLNFLFGGGTTSPPHPRNLVNRVEALPDGVEFNVIGLGPHQLPMTTQSLLLGATSASDWRTTATTSAGSWRRTNNSWRGRRGSRRSSGARWRRPRKRGNCWGCVGGREGVLQSSIAIRYLKNVSDDDGHL